MSHEPRCEKCGCRVPGAHRFCDDCLVKRDVTYDEHVHEEQMKATKKRWTVVLHLPPDLLGTVSPEGMHKVTHLEKQNAELFKTCKQQIFILSEIDKHLKDFTVPPNKVLTNIRNTITPEPREFWLSEVEGHYEIHTSEYKALECAPTVFKVREVK